jgi:type I restriction enzyme S subunit
MNELPVGWAQASLGDLMRPEYGKALQQEKRVKTGTIPVFGSSGIVGYHDAALVSGPVIVIGRKGNVGASYLTMAGCWPIDTTYFLRVPPNVDPDFVAYQLQSLRLGSLDSSTAVPSLRRQDLEAQLVVIAPTAEQKRIVAAIEEQFSRLDAGVAALARVRQNLKRMRAAVLRAAVTGALVPDDASRWERRQFATLGTLDRGKSPHRPRNDPVLYGGPYPFIQTGDVAAADPWIDQHTQTYSSVGLAQSRLWQAGTLCITIAANIAKTGLLTFEACFPDSVVGFIADDGLMATRWVELVIRSMQDRLEQLAPATAQKNINLAVLRALEIPYPNLAYQEEALSEYDRQMSLLGALDRTASVEGRRAGALRSAILVVAFSGRLVPQDRDDQPATALLERIAADRASSSNHKPGRASKAKAPRRSAGHQDRHKLRIGIQLMWEDGYAMAEIAETMEMTSPSLGNEVTRMRKEGWDLPYRRRKAPA